MVRLHVRNHRVFQRATALLIVTGAATASVSAGAGSQTLRLLAVAIALVAGMAAHQQGRSIWITAAAALTGTALAVGVWPQLTATGAWVSGLPSWSFDPAGQAVAGALFGLVSGVGLFAAHVVPFERAGAARMDRTTLEEEERALCVRAIRAQSRIRSELAIEATPESRALTDNAVRLVDGVIGLAVRSSDLRRSLRLVRAERLKAGGDQPGLCEDVGVVPAEGASPTAAIADLESASRRLSAQIHLYVHALERTALDLLGRRASHSVDAAAALAPLSEQLVDGGERLRAQASALAELSDAAAG
jgi:hypothetical protein